MFKGRKHYEKLKTTVDLSLYHQHRNSMQTGDALQWRSRGTLGWLIRRLSKNVDPTKRKLPGYDVNHTGLVIRFRKYDVERIFTLEALEGGIVLNPLSYGIASYNGNVWWMPLKRKYRKTRPAIGKHALGYAGINYDFPGLFEQSHKRVMLDDNLLFCSEYATICWMKGFANHLFQELQGLKISPRPCDVPDLGIFQKVVEISGKALSGIRR